MAAFFLNTVAHVVKDRIFKKQFVRSGETINRHFGNVLTTILQYHEILLRKPKPIAENPVDER